MLHRVDYKGCCEKQELLDRVTRLWKTMRTAPGIPHPNPFINAKELLISFSSCSC